jgi:HEAT repeat protein
VKEEEKICHECKTDIEPLNHRSYFEKLVNVLNHPDRDTRIRAAYFLGELRDRRAIKPLAEVVNKVGDMEDLYFVEMVAFVLGKVREKEALPILIHLMEHPSFLLRRAALYSLSEFRSKEALKVIKKAVKDPTPIIQELAREILRAQRKADWKKNSNGKTIGATK